jgi:hypothetical protein
VRILDGNGKAIAAGPGGALSDWMTTDYVPFSINLEFTKPTTTTKGFIMIMRDNPSGLPENEASITIPITFK